MALRNDETRNNLNGTFSYQDISLIRIATRFQVTTTVGSMGTPGTYTAYGLYIFDGSPGSNKCPIAKIVPSTKYPEFACNGLTSSSFILTDLIEHRCELSGDEYILEDYTRINQLSFVFVHFTG